VLHFNKSILKETFKELSHFS